MHVKALTLLRLPLTWAKIGSIHHEVALLRRSYSTCNISSLDGIYPPIPTPFHNGGVIFYKKLKENLAVWNKIPFAGYVVQGSNGEYPFLYVDERLELVKQVRQAIPNTKLLIAGSGCESTSATIELSNKMADSGADMLLVVPPSYYKAQMVNHTTLFQHFSQVADKSTVPIILYNVPATTGVNIPVKTVVELSQHSNIIGLKESGGDVTRIGTIINQTKNSDFNVLAGSAGFLLASCAVGAVGGVCALANVLGKEVCDLHRLCREQKWQEAKTLQHRLIAPNTVVTAGFGVPGLKASMEWFGLYGGDPRPPLLPLSDEEKSELKRVFVSHGFL